MAAEQIVDFAVACGAMSPCAKSKRGVVIMRENGSVIGHGFNHPPAGRGCTGDDACRTACGQLCVHAEMDALRSLDWRHAGPLDVVHVKVVDGVLVPGGGPSCSSCARDMLDDGRVIAVWLFHTEGWRRYPIAEFYDLTMRACGLPILASGVVGNG